MLFFTSLFYFFWGGTARQAGGDNYKDWIEKRFSGSTKIFSDQGSISDCSSFAEK